MPRIRLGSSPAFEFELTVAEQEGSEAIVRAQAWIADEDGDVWTARSVFFADVFFCRAGALTTPAVYEDGISSSDKSALDESPLVSGLPCYLEHAWPGRLVVGPSLWKGGDVWVMPKRCSCTIDVAASEDPMWRVEAPLVVRIRKATLHTPDESRAEVPPFAYAVDARELLRWGEMPDGASLNDSSLWHPAPLTWENTGVLGEAQPHVQFRSA